MKQAGFPSLNLHQSTRGLLQQAVFPQSIYISLKEVLLQDSFPHTIYSIYGNLKEVFYCNKQFFPQSIYISLKEVLLQGQSFPQSIYISLKEVYCKDRFLTT